MFSLCFVLAVDNIKKMSQSWKAERQATVVEYFWTKKSNKKVSHVK